MQISQDLEILGNIKKFENIVDTDGDLRYIYEADARKQSFGNTKCEVVQVTERKTF